MSRSTRFAALLVVVAAAVFAPLSQAMTVITDNSPGQNGRAVGSTNPYAHAIRVFESREHPGASSTGVALTTENSTSQNRVTLLNAVSSPVPFTTENATSQNRVSLLNAAETGTLASSSNTFDWGDAGIGAGTVGGILLLIGAATLATVRRSGNRRLAV